ncbi:MAG: homocysteine S-methyltransferase family protein [Kiritimatiellales bacterium]
MTLKEKLHSGTLLLDGAMGTIIQTLEITPEQWNGHDGCNEWLNLSAPEILRSLHRAYLAAGSDAIEANTFGASPLTLGEYQLAERAYEISKAGAQLARECAAEFSTPEQRRFVFGAIGPGTKLPSLGHISFDELYDAYQVQIQGLLDGGVDGLLIETCQDPLQIKAALAAADALPGANSEIVRYVSLTVETTGTMLVGTSVAAAAAILAPYPVDILGLNCATGPDRMAPHIEMLAKLWRGNIACMPNAGMPETDAAGNVVYPLAPLPFAKKVAALMAAHGISVAGGCCGTTPEHIAELRKLVGTALRRRPQKIPALDGANALPQAASLFQPVDLTQQPAPLFIGERANATGSKRFRDALLNNDYENAFHILSEQEETGVHILDLSCGYTGRDERADIAVLVPRMARECRAPLMIDSTSAAAIEDALKRYGGRALINSINFEDGGARAERVVALARRYGAALVALTIDEKGMALPADEKFAVAKRIVDFCTARGLAPDDLLIDPLTFTVCSGDESLRDAAVQTLNAIRRIKAELPGVRTLLGLSNISFGLKPAARKILNAVFLHQAVAAGLDAAIVHAAAIVPLNEIPANLRTAAEALLNNDFSAGDPLENYINLFEYFQEAPEEKPETRPPAELLTDAIVRGKIPWMQTAMPVLLNTERAETILNELLLPAMREVGRLFNDGTLQLPFVLKSAEVMKHAVDLLKPHLQKTGAGERPPLILLATVAGDVHDIGKNLVGIILSNNGFDVLDLGIKVPVEQIINAVEKHHVIAIGLSGLLVKSTTVMAENLSAFERAGIKIPVMLGGAALSPEFVDQVCRPLYSGEVLYCKDAFVSLAALQEFKQTGHFPEPAPVKKKQPAAPKKPAPANEIIHRDVPVPDVPADTWIAERIDPDEVWHYLDTHVLTRGVWGYKQGELSDADYQTLRAVEILPNLAKVKQIARRVFVPQMIHGFFNCRAAGDTLLIQNPATGGEIPFAFPRSARTGICLADYFRTDRDIAGLMAVTLGGGIAKKEQELRAADRYLDYLLFHGLAVMSAEALAEFGHRQIRRQWGSHEGDLSLEEIRRRKLDQRRFAFGYPACPDLALNKICSELLDTRRIGITVTDLFILDPEVSTFALITHHPQAHYFAM